MRDMQYDGSTLKTPVVFPVSHGGSGGCHSWVSPAGSVFSSNSLLISGFLLLVQSSPLIHCSSVVFSCWSRVFL